MVALQVAIELNKWLEQPTHVVFRYSNTRVPDCTSSGTGLVITFDQKADGTAFWCELDRVTQKVHEQLP